jgi:hypothetical protein
VSTWTTLSGSGGLVLNDGRLLMVRLHPDGTQNFAFSQ